MILAAVMPMLAGVAGIDQDIVFIRHDRGRHDQDLRPQ